MHVAGKPQFSLVLCGTVLFVAALNAAAAEQPDMAALLKRMTLSPYSVSMRPPEFSGLTADGKSVSLAALRGRVVIVNFWASWCYECRPEMPVFERLHREFGPRGLSVIAINAREGAASVRAYARELRLTFPLVLDPRGKINSAYGVIGLPTTFLIGRDGRAVALAIGPRKWGGKTARALIEALLAGPPAPKGAP